MSNMLHFGLRDADYDALVAYATGERIETNDAARRLLVEKLAELKARRRGFVS